jgi:hypothetical protein
MTFFSPTSYSADLPRAEKTIVRQLLRLWVALTIAPANSLLARAATPRPDKLQEVQRPIEKGDLARVRT